MGIKNRGTRTVERAPRLGFCRSGALLGGFGCAAGSTVSLDAGGYEAVAAFHESVQARLVVVSLAVIHQEGCDTVECELGNQAYKLWTNHRKSGGGIVDGVETLDGES